MRLHRECADFSQLSRSKQKIPLTELALPFVQLPWSERKSSLHEFSLRHHQFQCYQQSSTFSNGEFLSSNHPDSLSANILLLHSLIFSTRFPNSFPPFLPWNSLHTRQPPAAFLFSFNSACAFKEKERLEKALPLFWRFVVVIRGESWAPRTEGNEIIIIIIPLRVRRSLLRRYHCSTLKSPPSLQYGPLNLMCGD